MRPLIRSRTTSFVAALLVAAALAAPAAASAATPSQGGSQQATKISAAVRGVMKKESIPGAIIGVWQPGRASYVKAFGVRDKATGAPMTPNLHMRIGSETKTFTGTAVLQLVDEGKVGLDDPISKYVGGVPNGQNITVRELGEMRSGLVSYTAVESWVKLLLAHPYRHWTPREVLAYGLREPPLFAPGTSFNYSNTNTVLLGLLVQRVRGEPLKVYIAKHILAPLKMNQTFFPTGAAFPSPHADGYTEQTANGKEGNATDWNPSWGWAAGAMTSTLKDMRIWAKSVATGSLISAATQREREKFLSAPGLEPAAYGFALFNIEGWIGHNGSLPGYQTLAVYLPQKKTTLVILLNSDIAPHGEALSTLMGEAVTKVISPGHVYRFNSKAQSEPES